MRTFLATRQTWSLKLRLRNDLYCVGWGVKLYTQSNEAGKAANLLLNKYMYIYQAYCALSLYYTTDRVRRTNCCECKWEVLYLTL